MDSMDTARAIVTALRDSGVRHVVIGPGSRSAPLVYALAEAAHPDRLRLHVRIDERSAAFTALGMALASGRPAAVVTTSGTATGNLLPAMMEAAHADIRLVAVTADRPTEVQFTGANQTTDQRDMFGVHARTSITVTGDTADYAKTHASVMGALAVGAGTDSSPTGPVHINARFREPLIPEPDTLAVKREAETGVQPVITPSQAQPRFTADKRWQQRGASYQDQLVEATGLRERHTVVVAGHGAGPIAHDFALALGLPLFAEPSSNARFSRNAIAAYPYLLGPEGGHGEHAHRLGKHIRRIVLFGRPTLSRQLQALLKRDDVKSAMYYPRPVGWFTPGARKEELITELQSLAEFAGTGPPGWLGSWQSAALRAQRALEQALTKRQHVVGKPGAMRTAQLVSATALGQLVLGSSSVIRDVDLVWRPPSEATATVFAHRGLAGIDGTISTASGISLATGERTTLMVGDLTFLYDTNGLLMGPTEQEPHLDIVVINDSGGAIFHGLEHGEVAQRPGMASVVERFFGTPHTVDIGAICAAHGIRHERLTSEQQLIHMLGDPTEGRRVLEVVSDRSQRSEVHAAVQAAVRATFV